MFKSIASEANNDYQEGMISVWASYSKPLPDRAAIFLQPSVLLAFERITKQESCDPLRAFDEAELIDRLRVIAVLARPGMQILKKNWDWAAGTGKSRRTIRRFPKRIREMAREIDCLNQAGCLFIAMMQLQPSDPDTESRSKLYKNLPDVLRAYAARLDGGIRQLRQSGAVVDAVVCRGFYRQLAANLVADVQRVTGHCYYPELAELLSATFAADEQDKTWGEADLKNLHERTRQEWPRPRIVEASLSLTCIRLTIEP